MRWAGLSAMVGGFLFVGIQPIHPPEILSSFTTSTWAIVLYVGVGPSAFASSSCSASRDLREASRRVRLAWSGGLSLVWPHVGADGGLSIRRSPDRVAVGNG